MDVHIAQNNNKTNKFCHQIETAICTLEAGTPWANCYKLYIGLFKEDFHRDLHMTKASMVLWNYCMKRQAQIHNAVPNSLFYNQEMNPHLANRAISQIYVTLGGTSGYTIETQTHFQPQNNA